MGALSLGFCADLDLAKPLCRGEGVHFTRRPDGKGVDLLPAKNLPVSWVAFHGSRDQACPTAAARGFAAPASGSPKSAPPSFFRRTGTRACLYSWSASQVVQRVCFTWSSIMATTAWLVMRRSRGQ
jgi:hypothetical protein